jgi:RHS repeat-associated protein
VFFLKPDVHGTPLERNIPSPAVAAAPGAPGLLTSSLDTVSATCRIVVDYDWSTTPVQVLDYYPYGSTRINQTTGGFTEGKQFISEYTDPETALSYLHARYYSTSNGQFLSEDPTFLAVGTSKLRELLDLSNGGNGSFSGTGSSEQKDRQALVRFLEDPQQMNSYGYARDNPITKSDPTGLWYKEFATGKQSWPSFQLELGQAAGQLSQDSPAWDYAISHPCKAGAVVGVGSGLGATEAAGGIVLGGAFNPTLAVAGLVNAYGWRQTTQAYFQYKATASRTSGGQVIFDSLVAGSAALGTPAQRQGLNLLSAALNVLLSVLQQQQTNNGNTSGSGKKSN